MTRFCRSLAVLLLLPLAAHSHEPVSFDKAWDYFKLYESDQGLVRSFDLSGRLQAESYWFDADEGDADDMTWRRFRFGFKSRLAGDMVVQLEGDFDLNEGSEDWYTRLTDAYVGYNPGDHLDLRVLKHSLGFTLDGATSSKKLLTLQRNNLTNNLWATDEYFTGLSAMGVVGEKGSYRVGVFSTDPSDEVDIEDGSYLVLIAAGYDFAEMFAVDSARFRLDYVYTDEDEDAGTAEFEQVVSLSSQWQWGEAGQWGLWTDLAAGEGFLSQSNIWGFSFMPIYNHSEHMQWVVRYTYLDSEDDNGLRLGRYEKEIVGGEGDEYNEIYGGFNLFFYGHKLKWQTGIQYTKMDDAAGDGGRYDGWGLTTGLRASW